MSTPIPETPVQAPQEEIYEEEEAKVMVASQAQLIWWKFRRHKLAMAAGLVVALIYGVALFCEFLSPALPDEYASRYTYAPPQRLHILDTSSGSPQIGLYVYDYKVTIDTFSLQRMFQVDVTKKVPVRLFARGFEYKLLGIIKSDRHLIGPADPQQRLYLLGADALGRDLLSRIIYGTRISMSIGLVGVAISLILGIILGGISGYYGGAIDNLIQRIIEFLRSLPTIPLWMGFAAALPPRWPCGIAARHPPPRRCACRRGRSDNPD